MNSSDLVFYSNLGLSDADTGGQTSTVGEPGIGNNGSQIFLTGNWYATRSLDGGQTWDHISPFNFSPVVDGGFCCDQTVIHDPSRDITVWLLQYVTSNNRNTLRLAVKRGPNLGNNVWHWWDSSLRPSMPIGLVNGLITITLLCRIIFSMWVPTYLRLATTTGRVQSSCGYR